MSRYLSLYDKRHLHARPTTLQSGWTCEYGLFYRALLQKRPIILRSSLLTTLQSGWTCTSDHFASYMYGWSRVCVCGCMSGCVSGCVCVMCVKKRVCVRNVCVCVCVCVRARVRECGWVHLYNKGHMPAHPIRSAVATSSCIHRALLRIWGGYS